MKARASNQTIGNVGMFYVCYRLSKLGWNAMPTTRNARGIDILAYSQDRARTITVQVKTLSKRSPVPFGQTLDNLISDYIVICRGVLRPDPETFILTPNEVKSAIHRGLKDSKVSYWLQPAAYEMPAYQEAWKRIGEG